MEEFSKEKPTCKRITHTLCITCAYVYTQDVLHEERDITLP